MRRRQAKTPEYGEERRSEKGDTLIEVLAALTILGIAALALLTAFATAITSSGEHRHLVTLDASVRAATKRGDRGVSESSADNLFGTCPISSSYTPSWNLSGSFTVSLVVESSTGTARTLRAPTRALSMDHKSGR